MLEKVKTGFPKYIMLLVRCSPDAWWALSPELRMDNDAHLLIWTSICYICTDTVSCKVLLSGNKCGRESALQLDHLYVSYAPSFTRCLLEKIRPATFYCYVYLHITYFYQQWCMENFLPSCASKHGACG